MWGIWMFSCVYAADVWCVCACVCACVCGCAYENVCVGVGVAVFFFWKQWFHDGVVVNCLLWLMSWVCHLIISHEMWHMRGNMCAGGRGKGNICERGKTILYMVLMNVWMGKYVYKIVWNPHAHKHTQWHRWLHYSICKRKHGLYNFFTHSIAELHGDIESLRESHKQKQAVHQQVSGIYMYSAGCQLCVYFPVFFNY